MEAPPDPRLLPLLAPLVRSANAGAADEELFGRMCVAVCRAGIPLARSALQLGARERLDFTVIGAAVNLASRIEAVAKRLGERLVATADVAAAAGTSGRSLGRHELRGVKETVELTAL